MDSDDWSGSPEDPPADPAVTESGTMIIRTWSEPGHPQGFRARITYGQTHALDVNTVSTADPDEVLRVVHEWLAAQPGNNRGA